MIFDLNKELKGVAYLLVDSRSLPTYLSFIFLLPLLVSFLVCLGLRPEKFREAVAFSWAWLFSHREKSSEIEADDG